MKLTTTSRDQSQLNYHSQPVKYHRRMSLPSPRLIDSHVHLDSDAFADDRDSVIERAHLSGVNNMIVPAVDATSWPRIRALCASSSTQFPAYGLHPMFISQHAPADVEVLSSWLATGDAVAVGEIGLDIHADGLDPSLQRDYFVRQLRLARAHHLPVIVHARGLLEEVTLTLRRVGALHGVVHSFSGSLQQAQRLWALGFCLGIGGTVTYERAQRLRRIVTDMPLEFLLLESDAPDQPDAAHRGQRNEPANVANICQCVAALRHTTATEIAAATTANAQRLFALKQHLA